MSKSKWTADVIIVMIFASVLAVLSIVNITTLQQTYDQNERLQEVNRFVDCLDPTTSCGKKLAAFNEAEREWLTGTMRSQAVCTLLTSRTALEHHDVAVLEQIYNDCVEARSAPPPPPPKSPVADDDDEGED